MNEPPQLSLLDDAFSAKFAPYILSFAGECLAAAANVTAFPAGANLPTGLQQVKVNGAFVSLKRNGTLRGCCGGIGEAVSILDAIRIAASRSISNDPRFPPVSSSELSDLDVEVWLLGELELVDASGEDRAEQIKVGEHGIRVSRGGRSGLLLPGNRTPEPL